MAEETKNDIERRFVQITQRAAGDDDNPVIEGDAAVFGVETVIGRWFREKILPGAFTRVLSENPDVVAAYNHDWNVVLGRTTAKTLELKETSKSLFYSTKINPKDPDAMAVYQRVKRGDVSQASFAFTVRTEKWTKAEEENGLALREIVEVDKLYDVGPVTFGAYPEASAQARSQAEAIQTLVLSDQAASSGAEDPGIRVRQVARRRKLELLEVKYTTRKDERS